MSTASKQSHGLFPSPVSFESKPAELYPTIIWNLTEFCSLRFVLSANPAHTKLQERQSQLAYSAPFYPSPWMNPKADGWEDAYAQAKDFVSQMTILEKVNLTTGVG